MELRNPQIIKIAILIVTVLLLIIIFIKKFIKDRYRKGSRIANTHFIKNDKYYKYLKMKFIILKVFVDCFGIASIILSLYLLARPYKIEIIEEKEYNRDIMLCMDISASVWKLDAEVINNLKQIINSLNGDRFGLMIFDGISVNIVPLTDDYNYALNKLEILQKIVSQSNTITNSSDYDIQEMNNLILATKKNSGTGRGSSLIGDGLASCVYNFNRLDEERSRIIVFATDNQLAGKPLVTLETAADIAKSKNIKVFGFAPVTHNIQYNPTAKNKYNTSQITAFNAAVEKTGGKLFIQNVDSINSAIKEIDSTSKSVNIDIIQKTKGEKYNG